MPDKSKKRVLVVEDDESLNHLYVELLEKEGYSVDTALDGEKGFLLLNQGGYDLVLLDIMLPKLDGLEILKKIRAENPKMLEQSIVLLTNLAENDTIATALKQNVKAYLVKSRYTPDQFIEQVKKLA